MNAIRILKLLVWFLLLSFFCCTSVRQASNNLSSRLPSPPPPHLPHHHLPPHIKEKLDCVLSARVLNFLLDNYDQPGFSALITKDFKEVYYQEGGTSNIEQRRPIHKDTKFYIASLTKPVTAIAILKLKEDGRLNLSDPIQNYMPEGYDFPEKKYNGKDAPITIKHLLTHSSGLTDMPNALFELKEISDLEKKNQISYNQAVFEYYKNKKLDTVPGTKYGYSNYGYFLLGLIIEKRSRMSYAQYLKENLFDVAGMNNTEVVTHNIPLSDNKIASGYIYDSKLGFITTHSVYQYLGQSKGINIDIDENTLAQTFFSAGNIISTAEDLNKWYRALFDGKIISKELLKKAHTPHISINKTRSYGYGWIIDDYFVESEEDIEDIKEKRIIWHNGKISGGFTSSMVFHPFSKTLSILLSNLDHPEGVIENLALLVIDTFCIFDKKLYYGLSTL